MSTAEPEPRGTSNESLHEAFESFAKDVVSHERAKRGWAGDLTPDQQEELEEFFRDQFIATRVEIEVLPHNQWVRTWVVMHA
jgi:hypothetical protein